MDPATGQLTATIGKDSVLLLKKLLDRFGSLDTISSIPGMIDCPHINESFQVFVKTR